MSTLKSSNGWPASKDPAEIGIKSFKVPGTDLKIRCAEKVAPLLIGLASEFHETIEPIDKGTLDDWGYCFRMIRGTKCIALAKKYGCKWGGTYRNRKDDMHFEIALNPKQTKELIAKLGLVKDE